MNIAVDFGNTIAKVGIFKDDILEGQSFFSEPADLQRYLVQKSAENIIVSSVSVSPEEILGWCPASGKKIKLTADLALPITILYKTPDTLGVDRIAAVCGAFDLYPHEDCLVVDAGTCITFEFLDSKGNYHGGAISPGINMRFEAMHHFTARLPLVVSVDETPLIGTSTESSMQSGVINGVRAEVQGIIQKYRSSYPGIKTLLCGGDTHYFETPYATGVDVFPDLVLRGLNRILRHLL